MAFVVSKLNLILENVKFIYTLILCISFTFLLESLKFNDSINNEAQLLVQTNDIEGTYQIQMINTRSIAYFNQDWIQQIKDKRKQSEDSYLNIAPHMRIRILSHDAINSPNFQAPERVVYIQE